MILTMRDWSNLRTAVARSITFFRVASGIRQTRHAQSSRMSNRHRPSAKSGSDLRNESLSLLDPDAQHDVEIDWFRRTALRYADASTLGLGRMADIKVLEEVLRTSTSFYGADRREDSMTRNLVPAGKRRAPTVGRSNVAHHARVRLVRCDPKLPVHIT
jgi:hypothetical protein